MCLSNLRKLLVLGSAWLLVIVLYWPGLHGGFFFDDIANIVDAPAIQIKDFSVDSLLSVVNSGRAGPLGRPVSMLSFALNSFWSGLDPFVLKLTNLVIHGLNSLLVYMAVVFFLRAARCEFGRWKQEWVASFVALLWALHPLQLTSVIYVVQRMTSLSSMFVLMALIGHMWARQRGCITLREWLALGLTWGVFFPLAVLSKETGLLFVLYVFAYEAVLHRRYANGFDTFGRFYMAAMAILTCFAVWYTFLPRSGLLSAYEWRTFSIEQRLLTEARIVWDYVGLIATPMLSNFALYHDDYVVSQGVFHPVSTAFAIVGLGLSLIVSWIARKNLPLVAFGILWFLFGHSLESSVFPLELMHEHRNYLPSIGLLLLVAPLAQRVLSCGVLAALPLASIGFAFLFYCGLLTYMRSSMFGDDFRRTQIEAQYHPDSVRAQYDAGAILANLYDRHRSEMLAAMAIKHFQIANRLDSTFKLGLIGQLQLACLREGAAPNELVQALQQRLAENKWVPQDLTAIQAIAEMSNAGKLCMSRSQVDEVFRSAFHNRSISVIDRSILLSGYASYLWLGQKDYIAARDALSRAISDNPNDVLNRLNLLQLSRLLGDLDGVKAMLRELGRLKLNAIDARFLENVKTEIIAEPGTNESGQ